MIQKRLPPVQWPLPQQQQPQELTPNISRLLSDVVQKGQIRKLGHEACFAAIGRLCQEPTIAQWLLKQPLVQVRFNAFPQLMC